MRNMSFAYTVDQMHDRSKSETRRLGWANLMPGDRVCAVVKGMGLKKGEKVERICIIECVSNTPERLNEISQASVVCEGFPYWTPAQFVAKFCNINKCKPNRIINRIVFKYVD